MGRNETLVESITPPVEGIPGLPEMSNALFCYFPLLFLVDSGTEDEFDVRGKIGNRYRTDKYAKSLQSMRHLTVDVALTDRFFAPLRFLTDFRSKAH